jgi:uridine kinase
MDDLLEKMIAEFRSKSGQNLVVGISGIDGSGKSTLADEIEQALISREIPVTQIGLDDLLHPKHIRHKSSDHVQGYFEDNFDYVSLVERVLDPARNSACFKAEYPVLELETDQIRSRNLDFDGPGIVIVEGVFLFRKELSQKFHWKIWIEISFEDAMSRVLERSRDRRYGDVGAIRTRYETRFFPTQRFHLERDDPATSADFVLKSTSA